MLYVVCVVAVSTPMLHGCIAVIHFFSRVLVQLVLADEHTGYNIEGGCREVTVFNPGSFGATGGFVVYFPAENVVQPSSTRVTASQAAIASLELTDGAASDGVEPPPSPRHADDVGEVKGDDGGMAADVGANDIGEDSDEAGAGSVGAVEDPVSDGRLGHEGPEHDDSVGHGASDVEMEDVDGDVFGGVKQDVPVPVADDEW